MNATIQSSIHASRSAALVLFLSAAAAGCVGAEPADESPEGAASGASEALITTAGATNRPSFSWIPASPTTGTIHVDNVNGNDNTNNGTSASPFKSIGKAVGVATAGAVIFVRATGTPYTEFVALDALGTSAAPISLVGVPQAGGTVLPVWKAPDNTDKPLLRFRSKYWVVRGFDFDKTGRTSPRAVSFDAESQFNALLGSEIHGNYGHGVVIAGKDLLVHQNKSHDNVKVPASPGGDADAHAFRVGPGARRVVLSQNTAYGNSGDGIQCAGRDTGADATLDPEDVFLEDNRLHDNFENAVDIKSCSRVTVAGTDGVDGNKFYSFAPADTAPEGAAMVIHYFARNILVEKTRIWDSGIGITVGTAEGSAHNVQNVVIRRNVIFNLHQDDGAKGTAIRVGKVGGGTDIYNNTIDNAPGVGIDVGVMNYTGSTVNASTNTHVWHNIIRSAGGQAMKLRQTYAPGFTSSHNIFYNTAGAAKFYLENNSAATFAQWKSGTGQDTTVSAEVDPQFVANPLANDYYTVSGSYARDKATLTSPGSPSACGTALDIGFLESCN